MRGHRRGLSSLIVSLAMCAALSPSDPALGAGSESSSASDTAEILKNLPDGVHPLFVLGDINEDGKVNLEDLRVLKELLAAAASGGSVPDGVTCAAAADVNRDGLINAADEAMLKDWLSQTPELPIPALYWSDRLPCSNKGLIIASRVQSHPGETVPIVVAGKGIDPSSTNLLIHSGPAKVSRAASGRGFDLKISANAKGGDFVVLQLVSSDGRRYYYQLPVIEKSYLGEPPAPERVSH